MMAIKHMMFLDSGKEDFFFFRVGGVVGDSEVCFLEDFGFGLCCCWHFWGLALFFFF